MEIKILEPSILNDIEISRHYINLIADKKMERVLFKLDSNIDIDSSKFASDVEYRKTVCFSLMETLDEAIIDNTLAAVKDFGLDRLHVLYIFI